MTLVHTNRSRIDSFFHPRRLSQSPKEKGPRDAETVSLSSRHGNARGQEDRLHPVKRQRLEWQGGVEEEGEEEDEEEENGKANGKDEDEDKAITIDRDAAEPVLASTSLNGTVHPPNTTIGSGRPSMPLMQRTVSVQTEDSIVEGGTDDGDDSVDGAVTTTGPSQVRTDLEQALPDIEDETNQSSIAAYEAYKASQKTTEELHDGRGEGVAEPQLWRSSIYVDAFNLALDTVLADEAHLFNDVERRVFDEWKRLGYGAQYLYVRLFLRKAAAWHRTSSLAYADDIGDMLAAVQELQSSRGLPHSTEQPVQHPGELEPSDTPMLADAFSFADDSEDHIHTLEEASSLLRLDELKALAKEAGAVGRNKAELLRSFRRTSKRQSGLAWLPLGRSDSTASSTDTPLDSEGPAQEESQRDLCREKTEDDDSARVYSGRDGHFVRKIMAETGPCVRLSLPTLILFERVHLVFYRSTEWTEKSLTTIILAKISRRSFPEYIVSRSCNVFASRDVLLEFEGSLRSQFLVDSILELNGPPSAGGLQTVLAIADAVLPRWRVLLHEEQLREDTTYLSGEGYYLRRLSPAWVYTRILHKAAGVLGKRKEHRREHELLSELIGQRLFHTSRRGVWYTRRALLEERYMAALLDSSSDALAAQKKWKQVALRSCEQALQDPLVHLIHHHDLQRRVVRLERSLRVPRREQHCFAHVRLVAPAEMDYKGIRIADPYQRQRHYQQHQLGASVSSTGGGGGGGGGAAAAAPRPAVSARTVWIDPADGESRCTVEEMVLSHYRLRGWKGFHSEGGIIRTLFALILYNELFTYVPHVFQTAFHTCPLDLHGDGFWPTRRPALEAALAAIANGAAPARLRSTYAAHVARRTAIVGLDWSFRKCDLLDVVRCLGGPALAAILKVMAQEYSQRGAGVPDLIVWRRNGEDVRDVRDATSIIEVGDNDGDGDADDVSNDQDEDFGELHFVEVKSENDRLSDGQRLWINVLVGAGVMVELAHAVATEVQSG